MFDLRRGCARFPIRNSSRNALSNLILNPADASPGGAEILVRLQRQAAGAAVSRSATHARIEVSDHGTGIAAEHLERIWDPFFTTKPDGTSLGLAICRRIVDYHGGTIAVDEMLQTSVPGVYATGEVLGENMFVYAAVYEGSLAAENAVSGARRQRDYTALPRVIFTDRPASGGCGS